MGIEQRVTGMERTEFTALVLQYAGAVGIALTEEQAELCSRHIAIMLEWNRRINLTRITKPEEIILKHLLDSMLPAQYLPLSGHALDVGTGAGFPGIPLKILHPNLDLLLLDASRKKVSFLSTAVARLGLRFVQALHGRWESLVRAEEYKGRFELITMRAVKLERMHLEILAARLLHPGGFFAWWAGPESKGIASEASEMHFPDLGPYGSFSYKLPGISEERSVCIWQKNQQ